MATDEEIERRVGDTDSSRTTRRIAAAKRVGELARRRAAVAGQLAELEQELGAVLAESRDVIEIDELSRFTDVAAADLLQWLNSRKTIRTKRKRSAGTSTMRSQDSQGTTNPTTHGQPTVAATPVPARPS